MDNFDKMMKKFKELAIDYKVLIKKLLEKIEEEAIFSKKNSEYQGLSYQQLKEMAFELADISNYVNISIDPYLLIEITLLKYFQNTMKEEIKTTKLEPEDQKIISREINTKSMTNIKTPYLIVSKNNKEESKII